jgi:hypothetical protein
MTQDPKQNTNEKTYIRVCVIDRDDSEYDVILTMHLYVYLKDWPSKRQLVQTLEEKLSDGIGKPFVLDYIKILKTMPNNSIIWSYEKYCDNAVEIMCSSAWKSFWEYRYK